MEALLNKTTIIFPSNDDVLYNLKIGKLLENLEKVK